MTRKRESRRDRCAKLIIEWMGQSSTDKRLASYERDRRSDVPLGAARSCFWSGARYIVRVGIYHVDGTG